MTNIGNERGQVLNSVLTTGEGSGLDELCQGIVKRYKDAGEPQPDAIYVDRDCCSDRGGLRVICVYTCWLEMTVFLDCLHTFSESVPLHTNPKSHAQWAKQLHAPAK